VVFTYIFTQTTTKAVKNLQKTIENADLIIESVRLNKMEDFIEIVAKNMGVSLIN